MIFVYNEIMKKLLMIINNHSGLKNSKVELIDAMEVFSKSGYEVTTYCTQGVNDAYNYLKKNKIKYEVVCVFGGDGTLNEVTNGLMTKKEKPMIGYFPSGTMNDFGSNLNLSDSFKKIAENICKDKYQEFDVGDCNGKKFNYVAAFGALCDVPYTTDRKYKERIGNLAYVLKGISKLDEIEPIDIEYTVKGKTKSMKVLFGLIFSGGRVAGQQIVPKTRSKINDGQFNIILVEYVETLFDIPDYLAILVESNKYVHKLKASEITIKFKGKTNWTLDGEEAKFGNTVTIKNINRALKIKA